MPRKPSITYLPGRLAVLAAETAEIAAAMANLARGLELPLDAVRKAVRP